MDGTTKGGTEARVDLGMFEREVVESKESELIYGESKGPGDVSRCNKLRGFIRLGNKGHV